MLRLAQAASSEYYGKYGTPPNQRRTPGKLDGELNIVPFYGGWQYVFRPIKKEVAEHIAYLMEGAVENAKWIGYGQDSLASDGGKYKREGVFDALFKMSNADTRKIAELCNCDCSSLVGACVYNCGNHAIGLYDPALRTMWTGNEREMLMSTGEFVELTDPLLLELGTGLRRGDILLKTGDEGHTAVAIDSDDHYDTYPVQIQDCAFSRIRSGPGTEFESVSTVAVGTILHALGSTLSDTDTVWYRVVWNDIIGYTSSKYCKPLPSGACIADTWLRKEAGTKGTPIIVIPKGANVYLTGNKKRAMSGITPRVWYECVYGGHIGWASSLNIKE